MDINLYKKGSRSQMWKEKVLEYENQMIDDLKGLLSIESVRGFSSLK